jgi:hypothetical protein
MKHNQIYLENIQKEKLQFKKEVIEVTTQDAD